MSIKRVALLPCCHLDLIVRPVYGLVKQFIKDYKPDEIVLMGDYANMSSLTHWANDKKRQFEGKRYMKEINFLNQELDYLGKYTNKITYIEGNHENWCEQYIDKHPEMEGILEIPLMLKLAERDIEWIPLNELYSIGKRAKLYLTHGMWLGQYHAAKHLKMLGCNICYAHSHSTQTYLQNQKMQDPYMAYALGWLGDVRETKYMKNKPGNWINQFAIVEYTDTMFNVTPINIVNKQFIHNGKVYK